MHWRRVRASRMHYRMGRLKSVALKLTHHPTSIKYRRSQKPFHIVRMQPYNARTIALVTIAGVLTVTACASATKRYEQGQELEQQGRPADAAQRYIATLKKDPTYSEARQRLVESGRAAI